MSSPTPTPPTQTVQLPSHNGVPSWMRSFGSALEKGGSQLLMSSQVMAHRIEGAVLHLGFEVLERVFRGLIEAGGMLVATLRSSVEEATKWASSLASLQANNGFSYAKGNELVAGNAVFGISAERTAQIYGDRRNNPYLLSQRARALGFADPQNTGGLEKIAAVYQRMAAQGPLGRYQANARLDSLYGGQAPDEIRRLVNLRPQQIASQVAYGQGIQHSFNIDPEMLRKYAEEIPLAIDRVSFAFQQAKLKIAVGIAPFLEKTLGGVAAYIGQNAGRISEGIKAGVTWLIQVLPVQLLKGGAFLLKAASLIMKGVAWLAQGIADNGALLLQIFDTLLNGFIGFVKGLSALIGPNSWIGSNILAPIGSQVTGQPNNTPGQQAANTAAGGVVVKYGLGPASATAGWAAKTWRARQAAKAAANAATSSTTTVPAPAVPDPPASWWTRAGQAVKWFRKTPTFGISVAGLRTALVTAPLKIFGAGAAVGVAGYELARKVGIAGGASTFQIARYLVNRAGGLSDEDAALKAYGVDPDAAREVQRQRHLAAAQAAAGITPQQNVITALAQPLANAANAGSLKLADLSTQAGTMGDKYQAEILNELKGIRASNEGVRSAILDKNGQPIILGREVVNRIGAYLAEDTVRLARRGGR